MTALYDHIQALRAELRSCYLTRHERTEIETELAKAVAEQADRDRAFDEVFDAAIRGGEART